MDEKKNNIIDLDSAKARLKAADARAEITSLNDDEDNDGEPPKKRGKKILALILVLVIVFAVVLGAVFWDRLNVDSIRRLLTYGTSASQAEDTGIFEYEGATDEIYYALGDNLAVLTNNELNVFDKNGTSLYSKDVKMTKPTLDVGSSKAVAYDVGGSSLVVFSEKGQQAELSLTGNLMYISASLNSRDYLAVTAQKSGNKGCVSVYDDSMNLIFEFNSSERFVTNAYVTEDCDYLVAETLGQNDGTYISDMVVYKLKSDTQYSEFVISGGTVIAVGTVGGRTAALADNSLSFAIPASGEITADFNFSTEYLRGYSLDGDGYAALLLNRYRAGSVARIVTVNSSGEEVGTLDISEEVLDISASGRYVAALYSNKLVIYTKYMEEYATFENVGTAKNVCMKSDGSVWAVGAGGAGLFVP